MIRLYYRSLHNPEAYGEAMPVDTTKQASQICREANRLFPQFEHWWERDINTDKKG